MRLLATGLAFNLSDLLFDPNYPFTLCRICGTVYQDALSRLESPTDELTWLATENRRKWSLRHSKRHSEVEHAMLAMSGHWCTPKAAKKLTAYGVIDLIALGTSEEHIAAYAEGDVIPVEDCEGS